jgi:hypothetical protein
MSHVAIDCQSDNPKLVEAESARFMAPFAVTVCRMGNLLLVTRSGSPGLSVQEPSRYAHAEPVLFQRGVDCDVDIGVEGSPDHDVNTWRCMNADCDVSQCNRPVAWPVAPGPVRLRQRGHGDSLGVVWRQRKKGDQGRFQVAYNSVIAADSSSSEP